jgi:hypothetical protein
VTDGLDYQYDITFGYNGDYDLVSWSPQISGWLNKIYRPAVEAALKSSGHVPGPVIAERDDRDLTKGLIAGPNMPRYSHGYGDLRHLPTILVENHSLKPYRRRVFGTYVLLESSLKTLGDHARELHRAIAADVSAAPASIPMNWSYAADRKTAIDFLGINYETYESPATGGREVRWLGTPKVYRDLPVVLKSPALQLNRPKAYWVPSSKPEVIARIRKHGIRAETLSAPRAVRVEMYRLVDPQPQTSDRIYPFEGRHTLKTGVKSEQRTEMFMAGSIRISTDQPLGELAMALLEPASADSFFAWGLFLEVLQRTEYIEAYALAPRAERLLASDPKQKAEFEAKVASDPKFAADRTARLQWFYARSPFYDDRYLLYPVGIERPDE